MSIRIEKISVKNCGPLNNFSTELTDLNLIYSENERGKSYLVEFIIHSLFKNKNYWKDLRQPGQGRVILSGLENKYIEFSPSTRKKIEDYLEKQQKGLPPAICNLLIVKEGETEIVKNAYGVDKSVFKAILSPRRILDEMDLKISATLKGAKLEEGEINIKKQGEGKDYIELKEKIAKIEDLIKQIVSEYEQGEINDLRIKKQILLKEKELLLKAKRHKAYLLSKELKNLRTKQEKISQSVLEELKKLINDYVRLIDSIKRLNLEITSLKKQTEKMPELIDRKEMILRAKRHEAYNISKELEHIEKQLNKFSEEDIFQIQQNITKYADKSSEKEEKNKIINQLKEKSKDYLWLKSAKENYDRFISADLNTETKISFIAYISSFLLILGLILIFLEQKLLGIMLILLSALGASYYVLKLRKSFINYKEKEELKNIREEFFNRFGIKLESLFNLEKLLKEQEKNYYSLETYEKEIDRLNIEIKSIKRNIEEAFKRIGTQEINEANWHEQLLEIKNRRKLLLDQYQNLKRKLEELEVEERDYELNDPGIKFSKKEMEELKSEIADIERLSIQQTNKENEKKYLEIELSENRKRINEIFKNILGVELEESKWIAKSDEIEKEQNLIKNDIKKLEGLLEGLGVQEVEYEREDPQKVFSQHELEKIERELCLIENKIKEKDEELARLRDKIIQLTGIDFSTNWNEMIAQVYLKRKEIQEKLEDYEAKIISGILIHETIRELNQQEDEKLLEKINSPEITRLIEKLTGRYKSLSFAFPSQETASKFDENEIIISDEYSSFKLRDLSTGAKEQVMIALRIGFAKSLLKGETAFLILDDAFQHSDYKKRPLLINTLFELSKDGWQIIYLTMDDHLRDLFREKSHIISERFKEICLPYGK